MEYWKVNLAEAGPHACVLEINWIVSTIMRGGRRPWCSLRSQNTSAFILHRCESLLTLGAHRSAPLFRGTWEMTRPAAAETENHMCPPAGKTHEAAGSLGSPKKRSLSYAHNGRVKSPLAGVQPSVSPAENRRTAPIRNRGKWSWPSTSAEWPVDDLELDHVSKRWVQSSSKMKNKTRSSMNHAKWIYIW